MVSWRLTQSLARAGVAERRSAAVADGPPFPALTGALDALMFPWSCAVCGVEEQAGPLCAGCRATFVDEAATAARSACARCGLPAGPFADLKRGCAACRGRSLGFDAVMAVGPYDGPLRGLCLRLKWEHNAWLARWLADLWADARETALGEWPEDAWVVPVPLHWHRHWTRGYNQAEALARRLAQRLGRPVHCALRRAVATEKLAGLSRVGRLKAMQGAFRARPGARLAGRSILLVDDVLTTGATCGAAAAALKRAGAKRVFVAVLARTGTARA